MQKISWEVCIVEQYSTLLDSISLVYEQRIRWKVLKSKLLFKKIESFTCE